MKKNSDSPSFLIIGSGRLARHLEFYFTQKSLQFSVWNRRQDLRALEKLLPPSSHVLLAISDSALPAFSQNLVTHFADKTIVHFSGALSLPGTVAAHPLMSFGPHFYSLEDYEKIHFVLTGATVLSQAIPGLKNPFTTIPAEDKALYHALCVLGGNFPILLWQKMSEGFHRLGLPEGAQALYLEKIVENFNRHGAKSLTGPLVRRDHETIEKNLKALSGDSYQEIYTAFVEAYK